MLLQQTTPISQGIKTIEDISYSIHANQVVQPPHGFLIAEIKEESSHVSNRRLNSQPTDNDYNFYSQVLGHNLSADPIQLQEFIKENLSAQKLKNLK